MFTMRTCVAIALLCLGAPMTARAQSVFNMGGLTQTLTIPTAPAKGRRIRDRSAYRQALRPRPKAVARQMAVGFSQAGLTRLDNATKQEMAETLIYDAMFIAGLFKDAKTDPALKRWVANYAARGLNAHLGLDAKTLRMTPAGLQA